MGSSLRDLMRREKESRKRNSTDPRDSNGHKVQKTSQTEDSKPKNDHKSSFSEPPTLQYDDKPTGTAQLPSDFFDKPAQHTDILSSSHTETLEGVSDGLEFKVPAPLNLNRELEQKPQFNPTLFEEPGDLDVVEETYEVLDDEPEGSESVNGSKRQNRNLLKESYEDHKSHNADFFDENRLVYEQLNTAYCSNFEFEHERILRDAGIDSEAFGALANPESDEGLDDSRRGNVITSSNFGASSLSVSTNENLPVGFFDDQNVDAKARGKLTSKEAREKIRDLSRKRSSYLNEAKYIQEKFMEAHREKAKMENDQLENTEALKELQDKLAKIKGGLVLDATELNADPDRDVNVEQAIDKYADLDYDDLSWMSRSLV